MAERKTKTKKDADEVSTEVSKTVLKKSDVVKTITPHVSEKSANATIRGVYTFVIHKDLNKSELTKIIKKDHNVTAVKINMMHVKGEKRHIRGRSVSMRGFKKAVVYLKKGDKITFA